jgi:hypothetical protein
MIFFYNDESLPLRGSLGRLVGASLGREVDPAHVNTEGGANSPVN